MFSLEGRWINDAWYYEAEDAVHMYFLTRPEGSTEGLDIGQAVTRDLAPRLHVLRCRRQADGIHLPY